MAAEIRSRPSPADAIPFHKAAAAAIRDVPIHIGEWTGTDLTVPASAQKLLHPNQTLCRTYRNDKTGSHFDLLIVQCTDARDMAGHYPPICYPSQGWEASGEPNHVEFKVGANDIQTVRYEFHRRAFDHDRVTRIYGFFAVPDHGYPDDMAEIRAIAANYVDRPFGAAQIQIVFDDSVDRGDEINIVSLVLSQISDTLRVLADPAWRRK